MQSELMLMPVPAHLTLEQGQLPIDGSFSVSLTGFGEPRLERARQRFLDHLTLVTGIPFMAAAAGRHAQLIVHVEGSSRPVQELGEDESYTLHVGGNQATLDAPNPLGAMHGLQTFLQLVRITPAGFAAPAVEIRDSPRFPWRGLMLDVSRHFQPLTEVRQTLDGMEAVKMNVFHWHLSDNQGFRVESRRFPQLQGKGSDGLFYTQQEIVETIAYARDRGIRVMPEFDMPGHATAWFVGYPELASGPGPYAIEREWGVFDPAMDPTREEVYRFLDVFLAEMTALFPDRYFHVGGDECNGKEWDSNPRIQAWMRAHTMRDNAALQAYFTGRVQKLVAARGKVMVGWDEVLQPDTPKDVVIQSWRGQKSLGEAARGGYRGLLSAGYYIDLNQSAGDHYRADPEIIPDATAIDSLTPVEAGRILGGEATMWTEFISPEILDNRVWPRTAAIAERLWSPRSVTDVDSMYRRLAVVSRELGWLGLENGGVRYDMLQRISGVREPEALLTLARVVQPPQGYVRGTLRKYYQYTPLTSLVDAVPAESEQGREFTGLARRIVAGSASAQEHARARTLLETWTGNDRLLAPSLGSSPQTLELRPVSLHLAETATLGLTALNRLEAKGTQALPQGMVQTPAGQSAAKARLAELAKPEAVLLDMVVPGVMILVDGAGPAPAR